jgi:hypothetical protein
MEKTKMLSEKFPYRLIIRAANPDGNAEYKIPYITCHDAKSDGGRAFHNDAVTAVCAVDIEGTPYLYLRKDDEGHLMPEKTVNVKSTEAKFG